ncbi:MAG: TraB/GumN family protein [Erysipelotrichaceae bacterium]|nr:TraB/GumN family protein [Erysipelotrichaceae bacterium]
MEHQVVRLQYQEKELILIPTAHVSKDSAAFVKEVIEQEQPDSICIELDKDRYASLKQQKKWQDTKIIDVIKQKKAGYLLVNLLLSSYQKKMAEQLGSSSGQEMMEGIQASERLNIPLVLADRSIQTTFTRIWRTQSLWDKIKLLSIVVSTLFENEEISEEDLLALQQEDALNAALQEVTKEFPKIAQVLVHERDQYLAYKVKNAPGKKVIAILGAAHTIGMQKLIYEEYDIQPLDEIPPKGKWSTILLWSIPIILIALVIMTFTKDVDMGLSQILYWVIWNGSLSAIGCMIALAHPLTILTAFLAAPLTSLNPMLAAGWFAGLMEAHLRKPTVKDSEDIGDDLHSFKGLWKNKITRILLVVVLANIGSTLGTFIGGLSVVRTFFESLL